MSVFEIPVDNGLTGIERKTLYQSISNINTSLSRAGF
jgi:hypothetical protein